jgi:signal transduction histidine kinase
MFQSTRLKLTAWYLLIILFVSVLFSIAIFGNISSQIEGLIRMQNERIRNFQERPNQNNLPPPAPPIISAEELQQQELQLIYTLIFINLGIMMIAGGSGYFLAGRTLRPISLMIDEQNQFISDASHELRTPIATLRAEMEGKLLENSISDKQARSLISSNLEELGKLQNLSNNLLKLAQIHFINGNASREDISILEIVKTAVNKITPLAKKKNITIVIKAREAIINGNKNTLTEVFVILLDNAVKYSPEDTEINVSSINLAQKIKISVADQGIGISEKDLPHIFERFYRADKSRSQTAGYGLGLSIAKNIIESHSGSINVTSETGKGTVFVVELPLWSS